MFCTGGRARMLDVPGADLPGVHTLRTIDDAQRLGPALRPGARVAVVGGGWIGLEVAATARKRGAEVTVIEAMRRLCERSVPAALSEYLLALHAVRGTEVLLDTGVVGISAIASGGLRVALANGREIDCDAAVVGIGLVPQRRAGACGRAGLRRRRAGRRAVPHVRSGHLRCRRRGGCAQWLGREQHAARVVAERSGAGHCRGKVRARTHGALQPAAVVLVRPSTDTNLQDLWRAAAHPTQVVVRGDPASGSFVFFYLEGQCVTAALGGNAARDLRFARRLIEQRKLVRPQDLADPAVSLAKL
ncbi:FAD-dependent oxidoreductase [Cupriavidus basilensis]